MQAGRIYIGMMFSPAESVSTWPDAPFKYATARKPSPVVFSIPNSSAVLTAAATTGNLLRRLSTSHTFGRQRYRSTGFRPRRIV